MSDALEKARANIAISAQVSPVDPDNCRFTVSRVVYEGPASFFPDRESGTGQPLIERLFRIAGVASVLVSGHTVTVGKASDAPWGQLLRPIGVAIREQLLSGAPCVVEQRERQVGRMRTDGELEKTIQEVLDREINPGIAGHGGRISVEDVQQGVLRVQMSGGCQGCAASKVTLRQGVEVVIRRAFPEIKDIVDVTDHASGSTPYY